MDPMGTAHRRGRGLGEADVPNPALPDQISQGPHGVLDRHLRSHAMLVIEINVLDTEAHQGGVAGAANMLRTPIDVAVAGGCLGIQDQPAFGGQKDLIAPSLDRLPYQGLIGPLAITHQPCPGRSIPVR